MSITQDDGSAVAEAQSRQIRTLQQTAHILDHRLLATHSATPSKSVAESPRRNSDAGSRHGGSDPGSNALDVGFELSRLTSRSILAFRKPRYTSDIPAASSDDEYRTAKKALDELRATIHKLTSLEMGESITESCVRELHLWYCHVGNFFLPLL